MTFDAETWDSPTGARLCVRVAAPDAAPKAVIAIEHGMAEHSARYARFAKALNKAGFAAVAHDHRGHGRTQAPDADPMRFARSKGAEKVLADSAYVRERMRETYPGVPVFAFGHSMGGLFAVNAVIEEADRLAGAAVWNTNLTLGPTLAVMRTLVELEALFKGASKPSAILHGLTFAAWEKRFSETGTGYDWLSHIEAEVRAYADDPSCGAPASLSLWRDFTRLAARGENARARGGVPREFPIHLAGGGEDPATDDAKAVRKLADRLRREGFTDVTLRIDEAARHETLNEIGHEAATADFIAWVEARLREG